MSEIALGHKIIGLDGGIDVGSMDAKSNAHKQVLWTLDNLV
jgi:hypothetical protein